MGDWLGADVSFLARRRFIANLAPTNADGGRNCGAQKKLLCSEDDPVSAQPWSNPTAGEWNQVDAHTRGSVERLRSSTRRDAMVNTSTAASSGVNSAASAGVGNRHRTRRRTSTAIRNAP
jgi:hypothetical protein